jgi:chromosome segregation ATPase
MTELLERDTKIEAEQANGQHLTTRLQEADAQLAEVPKLQQTIKSIETSKRRDIYSRPDDLILSAAEAKKTSNLLDAERVKTGKLEARLKEAEGQAAEVPVLRARLAGLEEEQSSNAMIIRELRAVETGELNQSFATWCSTYAALSPGARETEVALAEKTAACDIAQGRIEDLEKQVQDVENLNRTINLLVSEKNSLSASLEQLAAVESRTSRMSARLFLF